MNQMDIDDAIACPFCGTTAQLELISMAEHRKQPDDTRVRVYCGRCAVDGSPSQSEHRAVCNWNERNEPTLR